MGIRFPTRGSKKPVHGKPPPLRPRLPSSDSRVPVKPSAQGSWKTPVGEYLELTGAFPAVVHAGFTKVLGRPVSEDSCRLLPLPVMMLKGRPEAKSTSGAKVQLLKNLLRK